MAAAPRRWERLEFQPFPVSVCLFVRVSVLCVHVHGTLSDSVTVWLSVSRCLCASLLLMSLSLCGCVCYFSMFACVSVKTTCLLQRKHCFQCAHNCRGTGNTAAAAEGALFSACTEWGAGRAGGLGAGARAYRPAQPAWPVFTPPCGCGLQHRGPWGRSQLLLLLLLIL